MGYAQSEERKKRLKRLYIKTRNSYGAGVYYDRDKKRYIRYSLNRNGKTGYLKRLTNKRLRKNHIISPKGNQYRRYLEYWWELT